MVEPAKNTICLWYDGDAEDAERFYAVRYLEIRSIEDLYSEETLRILHEAIILDEMMAKVKP